MRSSTISLAVDVQQIVDLPVAALHPHFTHCTVWMVDQINVGDVADVPPGRAKLRVDPDARSLLRSQTITLGHSRTLPNPHTEHLPTKIHFAAGPRLTPGWSVAGCSVGLRPLPRWPSSYPVPVPTVARTTRGLVGPPASPQLSEHTAGWQRG